MYVKRPWLFLGIGLVVIPISLVITGLQYLLFSATSLVGIDPNGEGGGFRVGLGGLDRHGADAPRPRPRAGGLRPRDRRDRRRSARSASAPPTAWRSTASGRCSARWRSPSAVVTVLSISIFLMPIAIWLAVRWALLVPAVELEEHSALGALRRSGRLVRLQWLKVGTLVVVARPSRSWPDRSSARS